MSKRLRPAGPIDREISGRLNPLRSPAECSASGGHGGVLTVRQKYLLGVLVDINHSDYEEISELPGISDTVARAIVEERKRRGGFRRPEDLLTVRGIKKKRLKKILPFITKFPNN